MKRGSHHRERPLQLRARQLKEAAPIRKTCGMHDGIDRAERRARSANQFGCRALFCQITAAPFDPGAGALARGRDRFQSLQPRGVSALSMQHQALIFGILDRQPARDRGPDPGSAAGND
jgi:hypothetical protein